MMQGFRTTILPTLGSKSSRTGGERTTDKNMDNSSSIQLNSQPSSAIYNHSVRAQGFQRLDNQTPDKSQNLFKQQEFIREEYDIESSYDHT
jgi:hypothetical protein